MAAFSGAKQNGVDDVFAMMAAQEAQDDQAQEQESDTGVSDEDGSEAGEAAADESDQDELISSILAPKQNTVDDLVNLAKEG
jgi:hypothetical protein